MIKMSNVKELNQINIKNLQRIIVFFYYLFLGASILSFVSFVVFVFIPKGVLELNGTYLSNLNFNLESIIVYHVRDINVDVISLKGILLSITFAVSVILCLLVLILKQIILIFKTLEIKNPFDEQNSKRVFVIGILLIISAFVSNALIALTYYKVIHELELQNVSVSLGVNGGLLIAGFLVMILSSIFKYGTYLQNEYDQTL